MKLLLYPHGGSGNHGCEAIVRSTLKLTGARVTLASSAPDQDRCYGLDTECRVIDARKPLDRISPAFWRSSVRRRLLGDRDALDKLAFRPLLRAADECDRALSIGGDNYCYGEQEHLYLINRELRRKRIPTILWGCSVSPGSIRGKLLEDLQGYDRIIARESLSYQSLLVAGLKQVELFPDPAFALDRHPTPLPKGFIEGNTIGINLSPMALSYESKKGALLEGCCELIAQIIRETDMQIALIPHVVWWHNDDRKPLGILYERFKTSGRVIMIEDRPAEEFKDIIARCRFLIAARTHACIAAYSSCIPTLALGYSLKAEGIARDILPKGFSGVLAAGRMARPEEVPEAFSLLRANEQSVRNHLRTFMPEYIGRLDKLLI